MSPVLIPLKLPIGLRIKIKMLNVPDTHTAWSGPFLMSQPLLYHLSPSPWLWDPTLAFSQFFKLTILPSITRPLFKLFPLSRRFSTPISHSSSTKPREILLTSSKSLLWTSQVSLLCGVIALTIVVCIQHYLCDNSINVYLCKMGTRAVLCLPLLIFISPKPNTVPNT